MTSSYAIAVVGQDRPGIVAAITEPLLAERLNIDDSEMAILRGHFTMMLVVSSEQTVDIPGLKLRLEEVQRAFELESVSVFELDPVADIEYPQATHSITIYGADHPGIVNATAKVLAASQINIVDLSTRVIGEDGTPVYVMAVDVVLPDGVASSDLEEMLGQVGSTEQVEVAIHQIDHEAL